MISEVNRYFSFQKRLLALSAIVSLNSGRSRRLICVVGYTQTGLGGLTFPKMRISASKISKQ